MAITTSSSIRVKPRARARLVDEVLMVEASPKEVMKKTTKQRV
jgi:hypothetical protein